MLLVFVRRHQETRALLFDTRRSVADLRAAALLAASASSAAIDGAALGADDDERLETALAERFVLHSGGAIYAYRRHATERSRVCMRTARRALRALDGAAHALAEGLDRLTGHGRPARAANALCECSGDEQTCACLMQRAVFRAGSQFLMVDVDVARHGGDDDASVASERFDTVPRKWHFGVAELEMFLADADEHSSLSSSVSLAPEQSLPARCVEWARRRPWFGERVASLARALGDSEPRAVMLRVFGARSLRNGAAAVLDVARDIGGDALLERVGETSSAAEALVCALEWLVHNDNDDVEPQYVAACGVVVVALLSAGDALQRRARVNRWDDHV